MKQTLTQDNLFEGSLKILQDKEKFCYGIDAVLLASFAQTRKEDRVYDLGTGNGIIPLIMCHKNPGAEYTGIEIQEECAELARENVMLNHMEERISIIREDIKLIPEHIPGNRATVVVSNPPYMAGQLNIKASEASPLQIARHEILCRVDDVARAASHLLNSGGSLYLIHRPNRLPEIFASLARHRLEPKRMRLVMPFAQQEPTMVLIEARKSARPDLKIEKPLVVYQRPGIYSDEVQKMYSEN